VGPQSFDRLTLPVLLFIWQTPKPVRYCRIKTTPRVARKDLLEINLRGLPPEIREQWLGWIG
jgi:hypothetical protein